uniref:Annexin n=1 Tax=Fundulus heteroclitus TaxID=8078 RepID=A0A3Q2PB78_FUNHE
MWLLQPPAVGRLPDASPIGTVKDQASFKAEEDVAALRKAIEGLGEQTNDPYQCKTTPVIIQKVCVQCNIFLLIVTGTTEKTLIEVLTKRSNAQRQLIATAYQKATGRVHELPLKSIHAPCEAGGEEGKDSYYTGTSKMSGNKPLTAVVMASVTPNESSKSLHQPRSLVLLCFVISALIEYKNISKKTLQESIESEMSGDLEKLLVAVVKCVKNVPAYFAERLFKAMKGAGTTESTLTRIMVSRSEIDLMDIKAEYKKLFGYTLHSQLESEVSGNYGETLKQLCGQDG